MDKRIHFGWFVAWSRINSGLSQQEFGDRVRMTGRNVSRIEKMAEPISHASNIASIARALGYAPEDFEGIWRSTPVSKPKDRDIDPLRRLAEVFTKFAKRSKDQREKVAEMLSPEVVTILRDTLNAATGLGVHIREDKPQRFSVNDGGE